MSWAIEREHLEAASRAVGAHAVRTALVPASQLGPNVWLKLESEQKTGSFKVRGALARLAALAPEERAKGVVAASAGNHGLGVAFAARALGVEARVFVPRDAPMVKREGIARFGARVEVMDEPGYDAAEARARAAVANTGEVFVSPYDDPWVAAGNGGTLAAEIFGQLTDVGTFVIPVGGGGLLAGIAAAACHMGEKAKLVGVQSEASPAMTRSLVDGRAYETWDSEPTFAEGLEGGVAAGSVERAKAAGVQMHLVSEAAIAEAMRFAGAKLGLRIEGSSAVAIAHLMANPPAAGPATVVVVTGKNVDERVWRAVMAGESDPLRAKITGPAQPLAAAESGAESASESESESDSESEAE
ncbi:MAG: pyridoxal-phosphate dependent enzyme [Deltaproteobacteria bacterium]|nr:pyridoxal-phosphate dependent enzyme [Deltaproteobacteria bacterium]